jgi:phospholipid/cholesterol/gamma-HCH transport system substrate-binding protein
MTDIPTQQGRRSRPSDEELMNTVPRDGGGREVRVGIFVLIGLISFVIILFLMTDPATLRGRYMVVTTLENAGGVRKGDPIQMRGVNIGRVHRFEMLSSAQVAVTMELEDNWQVPRDSRVQLGAAGVFGGRTVEILRGSDATPLKNYDTIPGVGADPGGLMGSAEELSDKAGTVLASVQAMLTDSTVESMKGSATQLEILLTQLSGAVSEQRGTLQELTSSLARSAEGLEGAAAAGPDVARAIARADTAMAVLAETGTNLDLATASLRSLLDRIDRGEGTLGRLALDDALYTNLNQAAESFAALVEDVRVNPNKYINISIF